MRTAVIGIILAAASSGCATNSDANETADCADVVTIDGVSFDREMHNDGLIEEQSLTDSLGTVETAQCGRMASDGIESTYLPVGTQLQEIVGHDPASRFAAPTSDGIIVYGRRAPGGPATALDDVQLVSVLSEYDGATELGRIDDARTIDALVAELDPSTFGGPAPAGWDPQRRVFIGLVHADGLSTQLVYDVATNMFLHGARPTDAWATEVIAAIGRAGDGVVEGSFVVRSNGERIPLRLAGACFSDEAHAVVTSGELIEVDDSRTVQYVFGRFFGDTGNYIDSAGIAPPGEGFTSPGSSFMIEPGDPAVTRVIIEVAFLDSLGQPSSGIELCATLDLTRE